jgi:hypothetical protein
MGIRFWRCSREAAILAVSWIGYLPADPGIHRFASSIPVANFCFEMNNGFNNFCGGSCEYST